ncbi:hypothetical protein J2858_000351 [Neorhizobium galegae]|nr:hypothetical protein [Neorhizobium galegae]
MPSVPKLRNPPHKGGFFVVISYRDVILGVATAQ